MEHHNPLMTHPKSNHKFITIGEIMLRLTPPNYQKIRMANEFEATYGGSEANIALALANLGIDSTFFTVVPNNSIGKSAIRMLRSNDVHCTPVILSTPEETPTHRLGTYYLETGYGIRASKVTYDRKHSAITEYDLAKVDIRALVISVDRMEKGTGDKSAIQEVKEQYGIDAYPIVTVREIISYLHGREIDGKVYIDDEMKARMEAYLEKYGI